MSLTKKRAQVRKLVEQYEFEMALPRIRFRQTEFPIRHSGSSERKERLSKKILPFVSSPA
jgi:hypothetical protein